MKKVFSLLIVCFQLSLFYSQDKKVFNKIDSLNTAKEVQEFLDNDKNKINYYLNVEDRIDYDRYCTLIADSLNLNQKWQKADFDSNGLTDLLVTGKTSDAAKTIYILDKGDHFESKNLSKGQLFEQCSFSIVKDHTIEYHSVKILNRYGFTKRLTENLVYRFGEFIEENKIPERHNILEIQFETSGSHWNKSVLKMEIVSNRDVTWISRNDGFLTTGVYTTKLSKEKFKEIVDLLNYINFENLADEYEVGYSDAATIYLKVTYDNFKVKNIRDTGGMGTRGLRKLYDILDDLKGNQQWTKL
ncbi:DUF6438 domain-containing protein [Chryseobacterium sp. PBS4-4]|uniref:DUF6438 domain-containing protein n=1 Tax=Chryseobacterium edaphi TaxID=2976532 RepID=A0ABT2W5X1_9FLAO|nr:DUF6438 domain-containing protein [Chryseobacterium edaphi]MCU7617590.1 DUF6438 domain-containing protein [Chryseobacterium edaphi]